MCMDEKPMEKEIKCTIEALYHCLTHFESLDDASMTALLNAGYTNEHINEQLAKPGSKFYSDFGTSPLEIIKKLRQECPETMMNIPEPDSLGRIRLSFVLNEVIGNDGVIETGALTEEELSTMQTESRNGCMIRKVRTSRVVLTKECQAVLAVGKEAYYIITLYPGTQAPPLPKAGETNSFWDNHCFIEYEK